MAKTRIAITEPHGGECDDRRTLKIPSIGPIEAAPVPNFNRMPTKPENNRDFYADVARAFEHKSW